MDSSKSDEARTYRLESERLIRQHCEELNRKYETIEDCFEALYKSLNNGQGPICGNCGCGDFEKEYGARYGDCKNCGVKKHFTANTIYEDCRNPRPYLAAIYLLGKGVVFNASQLARATNVATSTAGVVYKKVQFVLASQMNRNNDVTEVNSCWYTPITTKRSIRTPAKEHPRAEQTALEDELSSKNAQSKSQKSPQENDQPARVLTKNEQKIWDLLAKDNIQFDTLLTKTNLQTGPLSSILSTLELDGLIVRDAGDHYSRARPQSNSATATYAKWFAHRNHKSQSRIKSTPSQNPAPSPDPSFNIDAELPSFNVIEEIVSTIIRIRLDFHGIARKYLQPYLAVYWCIDNRKKWSFKALLKACGNHGAISQMDIRAYVTPLMVTMKAAA